MTENANRQLLDEVNAASAWVHAHKVKPIWARRLDQDQSVETLEGTETAAAGDFLCRGIEEEVWPQTAKRLEEKYRATEEVDDDGWRKFIPQPDAAGVLAARIDHAFTLTAKWGKLSGKPGDYLVKDYSDKDTEYPADIWIVDSKLFHATYEVATND